MRTTIQNPIYIGDQVMTNSVAISAGAINPVLYFSHSIKAALEKTGRKSTGFHAHYRGQFSLLVGLSLTALLVREDQKQYCRKYFDDFLSCSDNFTQCAEEFDRVSLLVAEMVCSAMRAFLFLGSQRYFDDFIQAVISVVDPDSKASIKKKEKMNKLLEKLFQTCK
jgi:hypothetical protein